ncbi:MAG: outer membrane beta-barrel protein [Melioribacter sp.]|nr:outer membrane beta-barrel protein [Melioribacter sp.]
MKQHIKITLFTLFLLLFNFNLLAQTDIGFKGIGGKLGYIFPKDPAKNTINFGAVLNLGQIAPTFKLDAAVDYWSNSYKTEDFFGDDSETKTSAITIYALGKYYFTLQNSELKPYSGVGLGLVISRVSIDIPFFGSESESETDVGFRLVAGTDYQISPNVKLFAEASYHTNGIDFFGIFGGLIVSLSK